MRDTRKISLLIIISFALFSGCATTGNWRKEDTKREVAYQVLNVVDYGLARDGAKNSQGYKDINPIIGKNPSPKKIDRYFAISGVVHLGVSYLLPEEWRKPFQDMTLSIKGGMIVYSISRRW